MWLTWNLRWCGDDSLREVKRVFTKKDRALDYVDMMNGNAKANGINSRWYVEAKRVSTA